MNTSVSKERSPVAKLSSFLDTMKPQLTLALPKHLTSDRMARLALTAFSTNQKLQECSPSSIAASIMIAGQLGLEPGVNGAGYLVPYKGTCTFVPGWKGLVDLVARSGRGTVFTGVIYSDQEYTFTDGARRDLIIHNETDLDDESRITHAYAIGWVKDASMPIIELWRVSKLVRHRDKYNKVGKSHYSYRDWEMYSRKVPLLQVLKYMPCSVEVANAMAVSHAAEDGRGVTIENGIVIDTDMHGMGNVDAGTGEIITDKASDQISMPQSKTKSSGDANKEDSPPQKTEVVFSDFAEEGEIKYLKNKLGGLKNISQSEVMSEAGVLTLDNLTRDAFDALLEALKGKS